jgi:hypothetical protein
VSDQFPGLHASQFSKTYTEAENRDFTQRFNAITQAMAEAMLSKKSPGDPEVQAAVKQHYEFCLQFWTPSRAAYKSLALSYILPSPYRDSYEGVAAGLGQFTHDAVVIWADANLE